MRNTKRLRVAILVVAMAALIIVPVMEASAAGGLEFGVGTNASTSFSFSSFGFSFDLFGRFLLGMFALETALSTNSSFSSLYIMNTLATASSLYLCAGHLTNLLPHFGSTSLFAGLGIAFGEAIVFRLAVNVAASLGEMLFEPYLFLRASIGIDP